MKTLSLKHKLIILCLSIAIFAPIVGGVSFVLSRKVFELYDKIALITVPNTEHLGKMDSSFKNIMRALWRMTQVRDDATRARVLQKIEGSIETLKTHQTAYRSVELAPGEKEIYKSVAENWDTVHLEVDRLKKLSADEIATELLKPTLQVKVDAFEGSIEKLILFQNQVAQERHHLTNSMRDKTVTILLTIIILSLVLAGLSGAYVARLLASNLQKISKQLAEAGLQVSSAAKQIQGASLDLSQATTEQAASLEQTAASIEEMNSIIKKNSENARDTSRLSFQNLRKAEEGKEVIKKMVIAINEIDESNNTIVHEIDTSNKRIEEIIRVISDIGEKTKVINEIVFQTKLLSFNASVEAARAGEHGKGFAVVAEEVGNLAQMSGNAAKEISSMLDQGISKVRSIVQETKVSVQRQVDEGKSKVATGSKIAQECGSVLEGIVNSVSEVSRMSEEISVASSEQAQGVQEITKAVHQLDDVTQKNSSTTNETATAAQHLSVQADSLKAIVDELVRTVEGKTPQQNPKNLIKLEERKLSRSA